MDYRSHYERLISTRKDRLKLIGEYYERHHIIMKSMGGSDEDDNLVYLTPREHFVAHWLLWRIHRNVQSARAFWNMCTRNSKQEKYRSSRAYYEAKLAWIEKSDFSGKNNPMFGKTHSTATREKQSEKAKNRTSINGMLGKNHSEDSKKIMSQNRIGKGKWTDDRKDHMKSVMSSREVSSETRERMGKWQRGRKISEESRLRMSLAAKNRKKKS